MEKRFVGFLAGSLIIMVSYLYLQMLLHPPRPRQVDPQKVADAGGAEDNDAAARPDQADGGPKEFGSGEPPRESSDSAAVQSQPDDHSEVGAAAEPANEGAAIAKDAIPPRWFAIGSVDPSSSYRMLVTLNNRGASIERIELTPKYLDLDDTRGYLGNLALTDDPRKSGCRVNVVGEGTPAANATLNSDVSQIGLRGPQYTQGDDGQLTMETPGDLITELGGQPVSNVAEFQRIMDKTRPGQQIELTVDRPEGSETVTLTFTATLVRPPLQLLRPDSAAAMQNPSQSPLSFLLSLNQIGDQKVAYGKEEFEGLPSMRNGYWEATAIDGPEGPGVEFRWRLTDEELKQIGQSGGLEIIKRYRLARIPDGQMADPAARAYHLTFDVEIHNLGQEAKEIVYQLDGPTGTVLEGAWYSRKFRDVAWCEEGKNAQIFANSKIVKNAKSAEPNEVPDTELFSEGPATMKFAGCDVQYFGAILLAETRQPADHGQPPGELWSSQPPLFNRGVALPVSPLSRKLTDVTFRLNSDPITLGPEGTAQLRQRFEIFAGPKQTDVLEKYGLGDLIVYGWFGRVSQPMVAILHFFYGLVGNYGLAIIMLTVLVRGCMFPLGRKMALNAQKMQELAPEMKKIAEQYKNDMEKRTQVQRELFRKHNYNPFGGCLLMFLQLPIFIGLYRGLSIDIELRQAPLIPGISWCSNLAAPDQLLYWKDLLPFLTGTDGWLGPYLNILPLITCALFLVHQKLFTPPATDDQQQMQQQLMKFMMLFMAVMFFKVAAGLCIYFIASSIWGVAERKLLPKKKGPAQTPPTAPRTVPKVSGNGTSKRADKNRRKKPQKRR